MKYENEIRSFITEDEYNRLKLFFDSNAKLILTSNQETHYLQTGIDLRMQKDDRYAKLWLKDGIMHDDQRGEIEIYFNKEDFDNLYQIFNLLNYKTKIKWLRKRIEYDWDGIKVCLDNTKCYGYIIELEELKPDKNERDTININLRNKLESLGIKISSREEFEERFLDYEKNWEKYLSC
jgi:predicted adenylyl cyclase CyaB